MTLEYSIVYAIVGTLGFEGFRSMQQIIPPTDRVYYLFALRIAGEMGGIIAVPVVVLALLGNWVDKRYSSHPYAMIVGMALAAVISGFSIYRKALEYNEEYKKITSDSAVEKNKNE